jgi:hypothetical protein
MQQTQKKIYRKCIIGLTGTSWIAGLLIAGSDSPYMPYLNIIGLIVFFGASILLGKLLVPLNSNEIVLIYPGFHQKSDANIRIPKTRISKTRNRRINSRYALVT